MYRYKLFKLFYSEDWSRSNFFLQIQFTVKQIDDKEIFNLFVLM